MADNQNQATVIQNLEWQMWQLASAQSTQPVGTLPSNTEENPKAHVNAVILRNGTKLVEVPSKNRKQITFIEKQANVEDKAPEEIIEERSVK